MMLPVKMEWKCCETCEYWSGARQLTSYGMIAECLNIATVKCRKTEECSQRWGETCSHYAPWYEMAEHPLLATSLNQQAC